MRIRKAMVRTGSIAVLLLSVAWGSGAALARVEDDALQTATATLLGEAEGEASAALLGAPPALQVELAASLDHVETYVPILFQASVSQSQTSSALVYLWDLNGDGLTEEETVEPRIVHSFLENGVYEVSLIVASTEREEAAKSSVTVVIENRAPNALFSAPPVLGGEDQDRSVRFTDASSDRDGSIVAWSWSFGDRSESTAQHPTHRYERAGTYTVTLRVTDDDGDVSSPATRTVVVENASPTASFEAPATAAVGVPITLIDQSEDPEAAGRIVHVAWDFGDGSYLAGGPSGRGIYRHTYTTPGDYTITLFVIDADGGLGTARRSIRVIDPS